MRPVCPSSANPGWTDRSISSRYRAKIPPYCRVRFCYEDASPSFQQRYLPPKEWVSSKSSSESRPFSDSCYLFDAAARGALESACVCISHGTGNALCLRVENRPKIWLSPSGNDIKTCMSADDLRVSLFFLSVGTMTLTPPPRKAGHLSSIK